MTHTWKDVVQFRCCCDRKRLHAHVPPCDTCKLNDHDACENPQIDNPLI